MKPQFTHFRSSLHAVLGVAILVLAVSNAEAEYKRSQTAVAAAKDWANYHYQPAQRCAECHTHPIERRKDSLDLVLLTEYSIWQCFDKHAQAHAVLKGERGKKIAELLKQDVLKPSTGCLNCHGMQNLIDENKEKKVPEKETIKIEDGVNCGGCHGPSGALKAGDGWFTAHAEKTWRDNTAEQKYNKGMRDLRNPEVRGELCMSCHVGNAAEGKVVTHSMMAAGHPPLPPIELVTFAKNQPQHWRNAAKVPYFASKKDDKKVVENYHLQDVDFNRTKFALIGNLTAMRESFRLSAERSNFDTKIKREWVWPELSIDPDGGKEPANRWPEIAMAQSDCYACHHDLRYPGFRQERGFGYFVPGLEPIRVVPGRPTLRSWPLAGLAASSLASGAKLDGLKGLLAELAKATNTQPFGKGPDISKASADLAGWCDKLIEQVQKGELNRTRALVLARGLTKLWGDPDNRRQNPDYETARQIASLLLIVCEDLKLDENPNAKKKMAEIRELLNTEPYYNREKRVDIMLNVVKEALGQPDDFSAGIKSFRDYIADVSDPKQLENQIGLKNKFLLSLAVGLDAEKFTGVFRKKEIADALQKFSDEEQVRVLEKIAQYDPKDFKVKLKELGDLLPREQ